MNTKAYKIKNRINNYTVREYSDKHNIWIDYATNQTYMQACCYVRGLNEDREKRRKIIQESMKKSGAFSRKALE